MRRYARHWPRWSTDSRPAPRQLKIYLEQTRRSQALRGAQKVSAQEARGGLRLAALKLLVIAQLEDGVASRNIYIRWGGWRHAGRLPHSLTRIAEREAKYCVVTVEVPLLNHSASTG